MVNILLLGLAAVFLSLWIVTWWFISALKTPIDEKKEHVDYSWSMKAWACLFLFWIVFGPAVAGLAMTGQFHFFPVEGKLFLQNVFVVIVAWLFVLCRFLTKLQKGVWQHNNVTANSGTDAESTS